METSPSPEEIRAKALREARNSWRRYGTYKRRFEKEFPGSTAISPEGFFNNRIHEDSFLGGDKQNLSGRTIDRRQKLADRLVKFRDQLDDPSQFDKVYGESLARRMEAGKEVVVKEAMSASNADRTKQSIRTFVDKAK